MAKTQVTNRTALRLTQPTIDRLRVIARQKSEANPQKDIPWSVVGRELLERALVGEEERAHPPLRLA